MWNITAEHDNWSNCRFKSLHTFLADFLICLLLIVVSIVTLSYPIPSPLVHKPPYPATKILFPNQHDVYNVHIVQCTFINILCNGVLTL